MPRRGSHHGRVGGLNPYKTAFDMSHEVKGTCELGRLIPIMCEEVYPGEFWDLGVRSLIRFHPQVAPIMHEINVTFHDFFVASRNLWQDWREYITGGAQGTEADTKGLTPPTLQITDSGTGSVNAFLTGNQGHLFDYIYGNTEHYTFNAGNSANQPIVLPLLAYWNIWNEYYRDENLEPRIGESTISVARYFIDDVYQNNLNNLMWWTPAMRNWTKDYFTSALPFQQRGTAPAFPITIDNAPVTFNPTSVPVSFNNVSTSGLSGAFSSADVLGAVRLNGYASANSLQTNNPSIPINPATFASSTTWVTNGTGEVGPASVTMPSASLSNTSSLTSFDVNYLRYAVQIQKILERNARGGVRYNEWLYAHFGDRPRDERLDRPEYIGGSKSSISISEVLQTSATAGNDPSGVSETPQGTMAGHMVSYNGSRTGKYRVHEHGYIMRIMSIMPTPGYEDGIERMFFRRNRYDHLMPELVNLSEQAILNQEIFATGGTDDQTIWGYQPQYDELRIRRNRVCGELRVNIAGSIPSLGYWHLHRAFSALPTLGKEFVNYDGPDLTNRIMAVANVHPVIFSVGNIARAVRPLPYIGEPGLVDHH